MKTAIGTASRQAAFQFTVGVRTDRGRYRECSKAAVFAKQFHLLNVTIGQLCMLADGISDGSAGERASRLAVAVASEQVEQALCRMAPSGTLAWHELLGSAVCAASFHVFQQSQEAESQYEIGTTLTLALIAEQQLHIAHVGDSRAYLISPGTAAIRQLTTDHTLDKRIQAGPVRGLDRAPPQERRAMLYQAVGLTPLVQVELRTEPIAPGDAVLLCSQELTKQVCEADIGAIVRSEDDPQCACDRLVALANERGGEDGLSIAIISVV